MEQSRFVGSKLNLFVTLLIGLLASLLIAGPKILNPTYVDWLMGGDPLQHYLGWAIFRETDWLFPIGLNPQYGLDISSSIVYSDSIPLFAFLFKLFESILPKQFQYFGFWTLFCLTLQYWFGLKIVGLFTKNQVAIFIAAGIFLFSPLMMWRIGQHEALAAHFLILAALYLNIKKSNSYISFQWVVLLSTAILVHFYIFAMAFAFWLSSFMDRVFQSDKPQVLRRIPEFLIIILLLGLISWQAGYFVSTSSASDWGYGQFRFNLLSPLYPMGWSKFHLVPAVFQDFESFNYVGLGSIFIFTLGVTFSWHSRSLIIKFLREHRFFILSLVLLLIYSVSNRISFGEFTYYVQLPNSWGQYLNILRHSNRMFWPIFYALLTGSIFLIIHNIKSNTVVAMIFTTALFLQVSDTSPGWMWLRNSLMFPNPPEYGTPLQNQFWSEAAKRYKKVIRVPIENKSPLWGVFADYAAKYSLGTNSVYLARVNKEKVEDVNKALLETITTGKFDGDAIYIIDDWKILQSDISYNKKTDLLARIDGFNVIAPNWKNCKDCSSEFGNLEMSEWIPSNLALDTLFFNRNSPVRGLVLAAGWPSSAEDWGIWASANLSTLVIPMPKPLTKSLTLKLNLRALVGPSHPTQDFKITLNGTNMGKFTLTNFDDNVLSIPIPEQLQKKQFLVINFEFLNPISPKELGISSDDTRPLSVGLRSLKLEIN